MNFYTKGKQTHRHKQTCGCQAKKEMREGWTESLGLSTSYFI